MSMNKNQKVHMVFDLGIFVSVMITLIVVLDFFFLEMPLFNYCSSFIKWFGLLTNPEFLLNFYLT